MLKTNIVAGGITNLTDARYFAARGAQFLSFNLEDGSTLAISPDKAAAIKEWVEGPAFIGTFQLTPLLEIRFLVERLNLQMVQIGPFISIEDLAINPIGVPLIREVVIEQLNDFPPLLNQLDAMTASFDFIFINFEKNGISWSAIKENSFVFNHLKNWNSNSKLILAIAHDPSDTQEILDELHPFGLYLQGSEEVKVGFKSYDDLDEILDVIEED